MGNSDSLFDKVLNTTQENIFWKDVNRKIVGVNKAYLKYFGLADDNSVIGKRLDELGWHKDYKRFAEEEKRVLEGESRTDLKCTLMVNGEEREASVNLSPIYEDGQVVGIVGSFLDITPYINYDREIEALKKDLEKALKAEKKANRMNAELIGRLRMEIRNPLSAISTISYMDRYSDNTEQLAYDMRRVYAASNYLTALSKDLVDISYLEEGKLELEKIECAFEMIVDGIETVIRPLAEEKGLNFEVTRDYNRKKRLICDPGRVQQIAINLLLNSVRFTDEGMIGFYVTAVEEGDSLKVRFVVKDTGCGMSESFIPKMYDMFAQEKRNPNKYGKGSGLGLPMAKRLVELLNGTIEVDTEFDLGTTFTVDFVL